LALAVCGLIPALSYAENAKLKYPPAPLSDTVDDYHGRRIADPYRVLEDPAAPATREWITAENKVTEEYLSAVPERKQLKERLTGLWNYVRYGTPGVKAGRYYYSRNDGLQNQSVLYWTDSLDAEPKVLLDPNKLSADGTTALTGTTVSDDGKLLAYGLAKAGSDWQEWRVRRIDTGEDLSDELKWVKFSGASWLPDASGFYYSRYDEPAAGAELTGTNYYQKLYFHKLGTSQADDKLVYERRDEKEWGFDGHVTEDGRYLVISVWRGTERKNQVFYLDLKTPDAKVVELLKGFEAQFSFIANDGPVFYFKTDAEAARYRVIAIDTAKQDDSGKSADRREIIAEGEGVLEDVSLFGDTFIAVYLADAKNEVKRFTIDGKPLDPIQLPGIGSVGGFGGRRDAKETFYSFTGFTTPTITYRYDLVTGKSTVFRKPDVDFKPEDFETKQIFYSSRDGTRVPMFVTHRKGLKLDGSNPTLLYGYGGFNISLTPAFAPGRIAWLEMGGVVAIPNLRGGGEYGRDWHEAGMKSRKQNVFDDFISAGERLISDGYTRPDRLAISGGSNGGLLVGACLTQRPELFGAALPDVGVMDMLRFHKFTIGWAWVSEYGSADNADDFDTLLKYSPLHRLKAGTKYPATLVTTADHDDRVVPAHSFKFAAALQASQAGDAPTLIRIETSAGHGAGTPTSKQIEKLADQYAFLIRALKIGRK
jgi:prolyl oligopeptidase